MSEYKNVPENDAPKKPLTEGTMRGGAKRLQSNPKATLAPPAPTPQAAPEQKTISHRNAYDGLSLHWRNRLEALTLYKARAKSSYRDLQNAYALQERRFAYYTERNRELSRQNEMLKTENAELIAAVKELGKKALEAQQEAAGKLMRKRWFF